MNESGNHKLELLRTVLQLFRLKQKANFFTQFLFLSNEMSVVINYELLGNGRGNKYRHYLIVCDDLFVHSCIYLSELF